jgi:hypothetical protein
MLHGYFPSLTKVCHAFCPVRTWQVRPCYAKPQEPARWIFAHLTGIFSRGAGGVAGGFSPRLDFPYLSNI